jgi:hypothetical protein
MGIFSRLFGGNGEEGDGRSDEPGPDSQRLATATAGVAPAFATSQTPASPSPPPREASVTDDPTATRARAPLPKLPKRVAPPAAEAAPAPAPSPSPKADRHDATVVASVAPPPARKQPAVIIQPSVQRAATMQAVAPPPPEQTAVPQPLPQSKSQPNPAATTRDPIPPAPIPRWSGEQRRAKSVSEAFEMTVNASDDAPSAPAAGVSTVEDLEAVRGVFNEVAAVHVSQVRDIMLELRYGEAHPAWIESTKPALKSLRAMAAQMDLTDLVGALDEFCAAVGSNDRTVLMQRYQRLIELIPNAFSLDVERDRREPIIIEALLSQVEGVERPIIDKLFAVGLNRLDALLSANVDDLVVVANVRHDLAITIVDHFQSYKQTARSVMSAPDPVAEKKQLHDLLIVMSLQNDEFNRADKDWTEQARTAKRELRKQREQTFQKIKVALARLGEREQLSRLERLPFKDRIAMLDRYLSAQPRI